jgi:hypothetical protein
VEQDFRTDILVHSLPYLLVLGAVAMVVYVKLGL